MCKDQKDWTEWQEVARLVSSIGHTHSATLRFEVGLAAGGYTGFVSVELKASVPQLIGPGRHLSLSLSSHYPHQKHSTLPSLFCEMLRQMDQRIGQEAYRQTNLWTSPSDA